MRALRSSPPLVSFHLLAALTVLLSSLGTPADAQDAFGNESSVALNQAVAQERNTIDTIEAAPREDTNASVLKLCRLDRPSQIQRYYLECTDATTLQVEVQDVAAPGDHWQAKAKTWDSAPNTAVATAPGGQNVFGAPATVYTYGTTTPLRAFIECSYSHGTNNFQADGVIRLSTDGTCTPVITDMGLIDAINRTP